MSCVIHQPDVGCPQSIKTRSTAYVDADNQERRAPCLPRLSPTISLTQHNYRAAPRVRCLGAALHSLNITALDDIHSHDTMDFQLPQVFIPCSACVEQCAKEPNSSICFLLIISLRKSGKGVTMTACFVSQTTSFIVQSLCNSYHYHRNLLSD